MSTTPEQVAIALGEALSVKAKVELEHVRDAPFAVVAGPSGVPTWIDLKASHAASP